LRAKRNDTYRSYGVELNGPFRYVKHRAVENLRAMATTPTKSATRRFSIGAKRNPQTEAAILAAARDILIESDYSGFSIEAVARRAGAGKPTIYRWWPTKADLFIAVYATAKEAAVAPLSLGSLRADLIRYTTDLWRFWRQDPAGSAFRGLIAEAQGSPAALEALRGKFLGERLVAPRMMFLRAAERGEIAAAQIEDLMTLWIGLNWYHLLTGQIDDETAILRRISLLCR
jgi:AcrR family transcriptional regulator